MAIMEAFFLYAACASAMLVDDARLWVEEAVKTPLACQSYWAEWILLKLGIYILAI